MPLEVELHALRQEIRRSAARLREASRDLRRGPLERPVLRFLRGGLWRARR